MTIIEAIAELESDKELYMPEEWIESLDRDTPDGRLITALDMAIKALKRQRARGKKYRTEPCEDCISRVEVHDLLATWISSTNDEVREALEIINGKVEEISSVTPARSKGKWIEQPNGYECSECNILRAKGRTGKYSYCPNCGADMRGDNDGNIRQDASKKENDSILMAVANGTLLKDCDQWKQLKETITEIRDNNEHEGNGVTDLCKFLINYMGVLEDETNDWYTRH